MKTTTFLYLLSTILLSVALFSCGRGSSDGLFDDQLADGDSDGDQVDDQFADGDNVNDSEDADGANGGSNLSLASNTVGLYMHVSAGSTSDMLHEYGIVLESSSSAVVFFTPDTFEASVIDQVTSHSWASATIWPYTIDNRFFIIQEISGSDITEYDPRTNETLNSSHSGDEIDNDSFTVLGDSAYYYTERVRDPLSLSVEYIGGDLVLFDLAGAAFEETVLQDWENLPSGELFSSNEHLYGISKVDDQLEIYQFNLSTGEPSVLGSFTVEDDSEYQANWAFAVDNDTVYWARVRSADSLVEVWQYDLVNAPSIVSQINNVNTIFSMDIDNGHFVMSLGDGYLGLYDLNTDTFDSFDTGLEIFDVEIIYMEG